MPSLSEEGGGVAVGRGNCKIILLYYTYLFLKSNTLKKIFFSFALKKVKSFNVQFIFSGYIIYSIAFLQKKFY